MQAGSDNVGDFVDEREIYGDDGVDESECRVLSCGGASHAMMPLAALAPPTPASSEHFQGA